MLTLNAEKTLEKALESGQRFQEILLVDGNSTDRTLDIAKKMNARVIPQSEDKSPNLICKDFAAAKNRGIKNASFDWILSLDSDEWLPSETVNKIKEVIVSGTKPCFFWVERKHILNDQIILYSPANPGAHRFFNRKAVIGYRKPVHERLVPKDPSVMRVLDAYICVPLETNFKKIKKKWHHYIELEVGRHGDYSFLRCVELIAKMFKSFIGILLRYSKIIILNQKPRTPVKYILMNFWYYFQLSKALWLTYWRRRFRKKS